MDARTLLIVLALLTGGLDGSDVGADNVTAGQTYKEAEKEVTDFVNDQLRAALPRVVGGAGEATLGQKCTAAMMKVFGSVRRLKGWTLKFLDSIGKPSAGILKGTSFSLGHYDQCVDLMVTHKGLETHNRSDALFQGMYCKIRLQFSDPIVQAAKEYHRGSRNATDLGKLREIIQAAPYVPVTSEFMTHFLGICLPSSCTEDDVRQLLQIVSFPGSATVEKCEIKSEKELDKSQTTVMVVFLVLICLACASTLIDWCLHITAGDDLYRDKRCVSVTVSFSFCNNSKRLFKNVGNDADSPLAGHCVRGVVVASVAWITLGQTYLLPYDYFYEQSSSLENLKNYLAEDYFAYVVNYPLGIDALFVCYGFIMTYSLWFSACKAQDVRVNVCSLIVRNYFRILIPVMLCLGLAVLFPVFGSGPFWNDFTRDSIDKCYRNTWAYVGMYANFLDRDEQCFPHLWFASCLAQLTLAAIILCWILSRNTKLGIIVAVLLTLAGNVTAGIYTYVYSWDPSYVAYFARDVSNSFWKFNYALPLTHFGPYALGMLTGIFVARRSRYPLRPFLAATGWIICLCVVEGLMMFIFKYHMEPLGQFWSAVYATCHRTLFAVCVAWVILACSFGNGGFVNSVLSSRIFDPLFKLSYYSYIFNFIIIAFTVAVSREHFYYSHLDLILKSLSYIGASYIISYFLYMILEMPLRSLACSVGRKKSSQINVTSLNNFNISYKAENLTPNTTIKGSCKLWCVTNNKIATTYP